MFKQWLTENVSKSNVGGQVGALQSVIQKLNEKKKNASAQEKGKIQLDISKVQEKINKLKEATEYINLINEAKIGFKKHFSEINLDEGIVNKSVRGVGVKYARGQIEALQGGYTILERGKKETS